MPHKFIAFETDWGWIGVAFSEHGVLRVTFPQTTRQGVLGVLQIHLPGGTLATPDAFPEVVDQLRRYFSGQRVDFDVPLDLSGYSFFLYRVWEATRAIPYGETRSYAELAAAVGRPRAYRAIGRAMAINPTPIIVPCHRVLRSDGGLGGYGGGLALKERLLEMERRG